MDFLPYLRPPKAAAGSAGLNLRPALDQNQSPQPKRFLALSPQQASLGGKK